MQQDNLGDRMKLYENAERKYLTRRMPTIIRLDGKAFHSFTRGFKKPFDEVLIKSMQDTAIYLCKNVMGCKIAYTQSDEITLLLTDYENINTEAWFDKNVQKMVSISASMATLAFNNAFRDNVADFYKANVTNNCNSDSNEELYNKYCKKENTALFDARVWNLPKEEVVNCFIWRQNDATRNAIQMVGQANFSQKQLQGRSCNQIQEMLFQGKGINFNNFPAYQKRGSCIIKETYMKEETQRTRWIVDKDIPIFTQDRKYIEKYI